MLTNRQKIALLLYLRYRQRRRYHRAIWMHPLNSARLNQGQYHTIMNHLRNDNKKCYKFFRMTQTSFDELVTLLKPHIQKKDLPFRLSISPEERLTITLR